MRQHGRPILLRDGEPDVALTALPLGAGPEQISEADLQRLLHAHPECLPIAEIDPMFASPVPVCLELATTAGPIDNFMVTPGGLPVLVECKLWRNPQSRREVVGQIIDYAKELSRWSSSDLQREVARRVEREGDPIVALLREAGQEIDEIAFNDALTSNLRRGRFLLLIVGDGIREGVEAIAEYLQVHAGLHFSLGLVELPIFVLPNGQKLVVPRVLARTTLIVREVISLPSDLALRHVVEPEQRLEDVQSEDGDRRDFISNVVDAMVFDDPEQGNARPTPSGYLYLYMPAPANSCWISFLDKRDRIGIRLTSRAGTIGEAAIGRIIGDWENISAQLGGSAKLDEMAPGRFRIEEFLHVDRTADEESRQQAASWLRERLNAYVSLFRPRIREAVQELRET